MAMKSNMLPGYISSQQNRYKSAVENNQTDLVKRLTQDAINKNYSLKPEAAPPAPGVKKIINNTNKWSNDGIATFDSNTNGQPLSMMDKSYKKPLLTNVNNTEGNNSNNDTNVNRDSNTNDKNNDLPYQFVDPNALKQSSFNYDFTKDPQYLQALQTALNNAAAGTKSAQQQSLEALNERGISNSSISQNQHDQIAQQYNQQAQDSVNKLIPDLMQQAYGRYQNQEQQQRNEYLDAINEAQLFGHVTPRLSKLTGYKVGSPLLSEKQLSFDQKNKGLANELDQKQLDETIRNNKANNFTKETNANANATRAETAASKSTIGKDMTPLQQQTYVRQTVKPLLDQQIGKDSFDFDVKMNKYILKKEAIPQFNDVMNSIRGTINDSLIKTVYLQYGVPLPNYLKTPSNKDIISYSSNNTSSQASINPDWIKK
ncbi:hypothetical protein UFOVP103_11 [uncultured Caudovirales phage]|uniref:Uncharacterized protein n=1 Tax=uncultured Caudovirales phage TaxID=2100421 RepID=A0A6J5KZP6_9CAUD|nr:hypothetical protein UFOVP103_11 [uncultured Caudovirales phage]CAB5217043.1 hypothetical protein UFOVP197_44 [uncultured Caudovirales phage]